MQYIPQKKFQGLPGLCYHLHTVARKKMSSPNERKTDSIAEAIRGAMAAGNTNPRKAAVEAGLPENAIRTVLQGHPPSADRLQQIADALDLEFYFGPRRPAADMPADRDPMEGRLAALERDVGELRTMTSALLDRLDAASR